MSLLLNPPFHWHKTTMLSTASTQLSEHSQIPSNHHGHKNPAHPPLFSTVRSSTVTGPNPGIHSHSQCPLVAFHTGCCSAIQKISVQYPVTCLSSSASRSFTCPKPGPKPGIHSHLHTLLVLLNTGSISEIHTKSGHGLRETGSRPGIHSHSHSLLVVLKTGCISAIQARSGQVGSRPGIHSHSHSLLVVLKIPCFSEIQTISAHALSRVQCLSSGW